MAMLFKLSFNNMKKSIKDYAVYFLTLVLGVAIFYMFNSIDSQQAMIQVSSSQREMIKLMISMLGFVSVFVATILGLLIVYANNFLINRRKKEFGIYMTLGMGKGQISKIILIETLLVGVMSLFIGLLIGIFGSQFMSVLVAKMFEADMSGFEFIFSKAACIKTCIYFAIMYVAVMFFNTLTVSRYKLINLLNASKKSEKVKIKSQVLSIIIFIIASLILGYAYYKVSIDFKSLNSAKKLLPPILMGITGTILVFWSLSGFIIHIVKKCKKVYLKDTNMFVLRQLNNKINTTVVSMSVICIMLFITITILSSALSFRNSMQKELVEMTPVDINLHKMANLQETYIKYGDEFTSSKEQREDSKYEISKTLKENGFDINLLKDIVEISLYSTNNLTLGDFLGNTLDKIKKDFPRLAYDTPETIIKVSEYNKIARLYKIDEYSLNDNECIVLCDYKNMKEIRDKALANNDMLNILGNNYLLKYNQCKDGFIFIATNHINTGLILVPDSCPLSDDMRGEWLLAANYNADTDEKRQYIENEFSNNKSSTLLSNLKVKGLNIDGLSKISIMEASIGLATIITFIAIYLGIIFLIASAAILALKQLTESSDNKQRYTILRKIGCDEKMINKSLFMQIGIFFSLPLLLAIIHSIFGIKFALLVLSDVTSTRELLPSIIVTLIIMGIIYGAYFIATYFGSKNVIKED